MEDVGAQVATPVYIHQTLPSRFCEAARPMARKRDFCGSNFTQQPHQFQHNQRFQNPGGVWNPKVWGWDSIGFAAKPLEPDILGLGTAAVASSENRSEDDDSGSKKVPDDGPDDERLQLKLGGSLSPPSEQPVSRPSKRVRSGSPGTHTYPMCQVDHCKEDLSTAKDYHRRHKVCEIHSKSTKALVGNQMQRFCQQCSRFHLLSEFDEGKRSCRRRLAGHNRRRRKTQPEEITSRLSLPGNQNSPATANLDIVSLLAAFARAQGGGSPSALPDKEQLVQILAKIRSLPLPADFMAKMPLPGVLGQNNSENASPEQQNRLSGNTSSSSTMDLLPVLSASLAASAPDSLAAVSQSSQSSDSEKTKLTSVDRGAGLSFQERSTVDFPCSNNNYHRSPDSSDCQVQGIRCNLPLQLFSSSPEDSPPKLASDRKYFSSGSSNPMDDRSPSSSPLVAQKFFPMQTLTESMRHRNTSTNQEANENSEANGTPLQLFRQPNRGVDSHSIQNFPHQAGYTSSSGSDHSPSSLNSDAHDRTGRISFKLFDKDPSHFPGPLRAQIYKWLSQSPSEMESYIRPGCVILSIYVSMKSAAWEQLEENLLEHVNCLVQGSDSDFWKNGRFLVHTGRQLASHKDGKLKKCKSWRSWKTPEIISVSPLAVVSGKETALLLKGRNLTLPGTKVHCTEMGKYESIEVSDVAYQRGSCDEIHFDNFKIQDARPSGLGRFFIEVENGFKGNSFPIIIADATICQELRLLESEINEETVCDTDVEHQTVDLGRPRSRKEVLHFLNELGWLFQRQRFSRRLNGPDYEVARFKFLIIFSVERDYCALVKLLLDMFVERILGQLSKESIETLSEINLLSRATKRRCRKMVSLLVHYSVSSTNVASAMYIFPPNYAGPGGITPLHLAASMSGSDDMIDVLTSDPLEIGLHCWNSLLDASGQSPYSYALMRNNHSYNRLVARKLADRRNGQVSVPIDDKIVQQLACQEQRVAPQFDSRNKSCSRCAVRSMNLNRRNAGSRGSLQRPYVHFMLAVAAVCACVCLFYRALECDIRLEKIGHGTI